MLEEVQRDIVETPIYINIWLQQINLLSASLMKTHDFKFTIAPSHSFRLETLDFGLVMGVLEPSVDMGR